MTGIFDLSAAMSIAALTFGFLATISAFGGHAIRPGGRFWQLTPRGLASVAFLFLALSCGVANELVSTRETRTLTRQNAALLARVDESADRTETIAAAVDRPSAQLSAGLTDARLVFWNDGRDPLTDVSYDTAFFVRSITRFAEIGAEGDPFAPRPPPDPARLIRTDPIEHGILTGSRTIDVALPQEVLRPFARDTTGTVLSFDRHLLERYVGSVGADVAERLNGFLAPEPRPGMEYAIRTIGYLCVTATGTDKFGGLYTAFGVFSVENDGFRGTEIVDREIYDHAACRADHAAAVPAALPENVSLGDPTLDMVMRMEARARAFVPEPLPLPPLSDEQMREIFKDVDGPPDLRR